MGGGGATAVAEGQVTSAAQKARSQHGSSAGESIAVRVMQFCLLFKRAEFRTASH